MFRRLLIRSIACVSGSLLVLPEAWAGSTRVEFNRDILPILSDKCFACHGFDAKTRKAKLRLDTAEGAYALRDGAQAIKPGVLDRSEVWHRITSTDPEVVMPPPKRDKNLSEAEKDLLRRWIEQGAEYQPHWAFTLPKKIKPDAVAGEKNPIDHYILSRLKKEGMALSPEVDRPTLIRRVTLDLTGRDHHPHGFTMWMAGGGMKPGLTYGATDEFGYHAVENKVHVHDLHATIPHQLGIDHKCLTFRSQGRDFRLTDVHGRVVKDLLA